MTWPEVSLGEICNPKQHKTIPKSDLLEAGFVVYGANGPIGYYSDYTHDRTTIAVTCRGATCGTINVVPPKSYVTGNAMALDDLDEERVDLRFLRYALEHKGFETVINGAAQPQITRAPLLKYTLPLPPLDEQKRIAAILDKADELRRKRQSAIDRLNQLGQAIFHKMFGDPLNPNDWSCSTRKLDSVCEKITDGTHQSPAWADAGIPFIFVSNVRNHKIDFETKKFVDQDEYDKLTKNTKIEQGDVLYTCVGSYGHTAVVEGSKPFIFQRHIGHLKPQPDKINPTFLAWALETPALRHQADRYATGIAQKTVTLKVLKSFEIPLPSVERQQDFASKIALVNREVERQQRSFSALRSLGASLQHSAFRGEL